jgi:hypothetical protein
MIPEPRSWIQFPLATQFFVAHIPPSLTSAGSTDTVALERKQAVPTAAAYM